MIQSSFLVLDLKMICLKVDSMRLMNLSLIKQQMENNQKIKITRHHHLSMSHNPYQTQLVQVLIQNQLLVHQVVLLNQQMILLELKSQLLSHLDMRSLKLNQLRIKSKKLSLNQKTLKLNQKKIHLKLLRQYPT